MNQNLSDIIQIAEQYDLHPPAALPGPYQLGQPLNRWIDHTLLKPEATPSQVEELCKDALRYEFAAVCVNPIYIPNVVRLLKGSKVSVDAVAGFPLGAAPTQFKVFDTRQAIEMGVQEVDMVIPIGLLKGGEYAAVLEDISAVVEAAHPHKVIVKVILENCLLNRREKIIGCLLSQKAGADFVKTSTGFAASGATVEDIQLMRSVVGAQMGVKAAGGVRTLADALAMLKAGASRIGTSAGVKIMQESVTEQVK